MQLVVIGVLAGFFSALFGVGGGIVAVPLLVALARFHVRAAAATSLAAIGIIALAGAISYGVRGYVDVGAAALVGLPGAAGALAGTALQQRISVRWLALAFAVLLAAVGIRLLIA
jgi:uncharacterized membrane protein YfcA